MPKLTYIYFNVRGRGETPRLLLAAAGLPYEDKRIEFADWGALKPNVPWGQLPILEVDDQQIGHSMSIARYVAREGGFVGKNSLEEALVESVVDAVTDLREKMVEMHFKPEPEKAQAVKDFSEKTLSSTLPNLEKFAAANQEKPGVFVGGKMTIADVHFFSIIEILQEKMPNVLDQYPALKKVFEGVAADPKIDAYIKKRPATSF